MKIVVDPDRCACFGMCVSIAPDLFQMGDDGHVEIIDAGPLEMLHEEALEALAACPSQALSVED